MICTTGGGRKGTKQTVSKEPVLAGVESLLLHLDSCDPATDNPLFDQGCNPLTRSILEYKPKNQPALAPAPLACDHRYNPLMPPHGAPSSRHASVWVSRGKPRRATTALCYNPFCLLCAAIK
ncbi:hypothetical protein DPEC_G00055520 [Dallia pectoralis]|uniref:Uncharacterized protein n=1 Tax=Dallia pectoralis TaxID=75939 RepID=A0ACC2H6M0_DALPE|nr:hypothetical protein DPEC_G00055520 [Dallia pectoralis]